jgi:hypothetical protein
MTNEYAVQTAMPAGSGIAMLSAAPQGAGATGWPASWCMGAFGIRRPLLADLVLYRAKGGVGPVKPTAAKKPGTTKIPTNSNHMTRVIANSDGGSGSQPLREHPPA